MDKRTETSESVERVENWIWVQKRVGSVSGRISGSVQNQINRPDQLWAGLSPISSIYKLDFFSLGGGSLSNLVGPNLMNLKPAV